jgi:5'-deoxynucleotidase YfbR-like HD superfamily hydrolase
MSTRSDLEFIRSGMNVRRYHQRYTAQSDTVAHHSHGVAMLAYLIDPKLRKGVLMAALTHDLAEGVTGDMPGHIKAGLPASMQHELNATETQLLNKHGLLFELSLEESQLLKLCDKLESLLFCIEERERGNEGLRSCGDKCAVWINDIIRSGVSMPWINNARALTFAATVKWEHVK